MPLLPRFAVHQILRKDEVAVRLEERRNVGDSLTIVSILGDVIEHIDYGNYVKLPGLSGQRLRIGNILLHDLHIRILFPKFPDCHLRKIHARERANPEGPPDLKPESGPRAHIQDSNLPEIERQRTYLSYKHFLPHAVGPFIERLAIADVPHTLEAPFLRKSFFPILPGHERLVLCYSHFVDPQFSAPKNVRGAI